MMTDNERYDHLFDICEPLTQKEMADMLNQQESTVSRWYHKHCKVPALAEFVDLEDVRVYINKHPYIFNRIKDDYNKGQRQFRRYVK